MKSRSKTFDLPEPLASSSIAHATQKQEVRETSTKSRDFKIDLNVQCNGNKLATSKEVGANSTIKQHVANVNGGRLDSKLKSPSLYEVPLNTPTAYQNYSGSILDPSTNGPAASLRCKQKFRFYICLLAVFSFSLCIASRMALNIAINEICDPKTQDFSDETITRTHGKGIIPMDEHIEHLDHDRVYETKPHNNNQFVPERKKKPAASAKKIKYETHINETKKHDPIATTPEPTTSTTSDQTTTTTTKRPDDTKPEKAACGKQTRHFLVGAFYLGYFPIMLISGYLAEVYGAKTALFLAALGSGAINLVTPYIVDHIILMILLRVLLGALQAPVVPALYALCNMWLSKTEMSIFASFIKVSMGLGVLFGYLIPGLTPKMVGANYDWSAYFYIEGSICLLWSLVWFFLATSKPQDNRFVQLDELRWISRKKPVDLATISDKQSAPVTGHGSSTTEIDSSDEKNKPDHSIIYHIIRHPSVWALAVTKLTHNIGIDFVLIEFPSFMNLAHGKKLDEVSRRI